MEKPHKGRIIDWRSRDCDDGIGYYIVGRFIDHPEIPCGHRTHTSYVVKENGSEIETRNSRYTLIGEEIAEPKAA